MSGKDLFGYGSELTLSAKLQSNEALRQWNAGVVCTRPASRRRPAKSPPDVPSGAAHSAIVAVSPVVKPVKQERQKLVKQGLPKPVKQKRATVKLEPPTDDAIVKWEPPTEVAVMNLDGDDPNGAVDSRGRSAQYRLDERSRRHERQRETQEMGEMAIADYEGRMHRAVQNLYMCTGEVAFHLTNAVEELKKQMDHSQSSDVCEAGAAGSQKSATELANQLQHAVGRLQERVGQSNLIHDVKQERSTGEAGAACAPEGEERALILEHADMRAEDALSWLNEYRCFSRSVWLGSFEEGYNQGLVDSRRATPQGRTTSPMLVSAHY